VARPLRSGPTIDGAELSGYRIATVCSYRIALLVS